MFAAMATGAAKSESFLSAPSAIPRFVAGGAPFTGFPSFAGGAFGWMFPVSFFRGLSIPLLQGVAPRSGIAGNSGPISRPRYLFHSRSTRNLVGLLFC